MALNIDNQNGELVIDPHGYKSRNPFKGLDGRIKKEKTLLRALLDGFSIELTVDEMRELSHHVLEKMPKFCLIHIRADRD